jgi:hypothetical protein
MMPGGEIRNQVAAWALLAMFALAVAVWAAIYAKMTRSAIMLNAAVLLPSLVFVAEYLPRIALETRAHYVPAPYDCITFFPSLFGSLVGPPLLLATVITVRRSGGPLAAYAPSAIAAALWLTSAFFLLEGLVTIT